ncbi:MAG: hypothetical protein U0361_16575 [Nitrospiraceae bacterium]
MSTFAYDRTNPSGRRKKRRTDRQNAREEAVDQLRKQNVVVTSLEEKSGKGKFSLKLGSGLTDKDLVVFARQFGTMINAGLPLIQCLDILSTQSENKVLRGNRRRGEEQRRGRLDFPTR